MIKNLLSRYRPGYLSNLAYMMQASEYDPLKFLKWHWRTKDYSAIQKRGSLHLTKAAKLLLTWLWGLNLILWLYVAAVFLMVGRIGQSIDIVLIIYIIGFIWLMPYLVAYLAAFSLALAHLVFSWPMSKHWQNQTLKTLQKHQAKKIAIAGSYGKTSMKELLLTVLGEGKKVAATPANRNVASSHAAFARGLDGKEDVILIEYGEGQPGDVARFIKTTWPDIGIITGLAPAHLDQYPSLQAAAKDIMSLAVYLKDDIFVNGDSRLLRGFIKPEHHTYSAQGVLDWKVSNLRMDYEGLNFTMTKNDQKLELKSGLLGEHNVGPLALAAALADQIGLSGQQIKNGVAKTIPFEHRMQSRLLGGAWVIDDTYNGNIEGIEAGLKLLKTLPAKRKIYVTPGLVDQGAETQRIHQKIGRLIAEANPDIVVLMENSVTRFIEQGLKEASYKGELRVEDDPLDFYINLEQFVAAGDLVLMQNDWPDQYS